MKYQSGAWLVAGLLGMGLLWMGLSKTAQDAAHAASSRESDATVAATLATASEPAAGGVARPKPGVTSARAEPPYVPATWRELDEDELMRSLSELSTEDAALALQLAGDAKTRFPSSSRAAERDYFEVRALVNLGRLDDAVAKARALVAAHPDDPLANDVARHLLTHPMRHPTEIGSR
jgi:hypothetical protein